MLANKTVQKWIINSVLIVSVLFLIYSLTMSTDLYPLWKLKDYFDGAEVYDAVQPFNKLLLYLAAAMLVLAISVMIFFSRTRRVYYLSNYVTCGLFSLYAVFVSVLTIVNALKFRADYLKIDFETYEYFAEALSERYVNSTFFFDAGVVLSVVTVIVCGLTIALAVYKFRMRRKALGGTGR